MADIEEVYVRDLYKSIGLKNPIGGFYFLDKKIYQDDGEVVNEGFGLDREALEILRTKIRAILIDDLPIKENKFKPKN